MAIMRRITEINGEMVETMIIVGTFVQFILMEKYYLLDGKIVRSFRSWSEANKFRIDWIVPI